MVYTIISALAVLFVLVIFVTFAASSFVKMIRSKDRCCNCVWYSNGYCRQFSRGTDDLIEACHLFKKRSEN